MDSLLGIHSRWWKKLLKFKLIKCFQFSRFSVIKRNYKIQSISASLNFQCLTIEKILSKLFFPSPNHERVDKDIIHPKGRKWRRKKIISFSLFLFPPVPLSLMWNLLAKKRKKKKAFHYTKDVIKNKFGDENLCHSTTWDVENFMKNYHRRNDFWSSPPHHGLNGAWN
jgi:hypothetical protein